MGLQSWRMAGTARAARETAPTGSLIRDYLTAIGLTLTNSSTILSFIAAFGALSLAARDGGAAWLVIGVFLGSAACWLGLCSAIAIARRALTPQAMTWIDRISALILIGFGASAAANLL
jgi:threonine/homoserine/homoserine lactone efflux protein